MSELDRPLSLDEVMEIKREVEGKRGEYGKWESQPSRNRDSVEKGR